MPLSLEAYAKRQYHIKLRPLTGEEGGGWLAEIPSLPGCTSDGVNQLILTILANGMGGVYDPGPSAPRDDTVPGLSRERIPHYHRRSRAPSRRNQ